MKIKICGLSTAQSVDTSARLGADYFGLVHFAKSPRHVTLERAAQLREHAAGRMKAVLLLVNADPTLTAKAIEMVRPDVIQFHGSETPEWLKLVKDKTGLEVWKALGVSDRHTLTNSMRFNGIADRLIFDAPAQKLPGGTGTTIDWNLLAEFQHQTDWGLAGGLTPENVEEALEITHAPLVDVSSGVEGRRGIKDVDKIVAFCEAVRRYDQRQNQA